MTRKTLTILLLALVLNAGAQSNLVADTIEIARQLAWNKEFKAANDLLALYNQNHRNADAIRLQAQVLHWIGKSGEAIRLIGPAVAEFPHQPAVQLDYARILFEAGRINRSRQQYQQYLGTDSSNAEAMLHTAYIDRWNGKTGLAKNETAAMLQKYPGNQAATDLQKVMRMESTPWLRAGAGYLSDDQPLQVPSLSLEAGWYKSWAVSPQILVRWNSMQAGETNISLQALLTNQFYIGATGTALTLGAGVATLNAEQSPTAKVALTQKVARNFHLDLGWEKRAYQHTAASTEQLLMQQFTQASLKYNKQDKWMAQASLERQQFEDDNVVQTLYAWMLVPVWQSKKWSFSTGYSFAVSDADSNTFKPARSLADIISTGGQITGIYDPYFTPSNQLTHSLLLSASISLSKSVQWKLRASAAFAGRADNPYFYLNRNNGGQGPFHIVRSFYEEDYRPFEGYTELQWKASSITTLQVFYQYSSLLFYKRHITGFTLKFPLSHAGQ